MKKIVLLLALLTCLFVSQEARAGASGYSTGYDPGVVDSRSFQSIANAVTTLGSASTTLFITTTELVSTNVTVPSNITLQFSTSGIINVTSPNTLTINGGIIAGPYPIFTGTGSVSISSKQRYFPPVWGTFSVTSDYPFGNMNFGTTSLINGSQIISFATGSTYSTSISYYGFATTQGAGGTTSVTQQSGSQMTVKGSGTDKVNWWAIGR